MGNATALSIGQFLPQFQERLLGNTGIGSNAARSNPADQSTEHAKAMTGDRIGGAPAVAGADALVLHRETQRMAMHFELREAAAKIVENGQDGSQSAQAYANQLTFSFFFEAQQEQLAVFNARTGKVAEGLEGAQRQSFMATRNTVAMRFSMSMNISSVALQGFANAAESAANTTNGIDRLMKTANDLLAKSDEVFSKVFALIDGFFKGEGDLQTRFNQLFAGLQELGLVNMPGFAQGAPASGASVQASRFEFSMQLEFGFTSESVTIQQADPLVLDLTGTGINLSSVFEGAMFDITASGQAVQTAFVTGGDAFLALDRNGNGIIDDASELFGDQTGYANGFEALRAFDGNGDGVIDAQDEIFASLLLWIDNGNGITEPGELISLADAGITSLDLNYRDVDEAAMGGNRVTQLGAYEMANGKRGVMADVLLNYLA